MFGHALQVASRLNDSGEPMKILISQDTKILLDSFGNFRTEYCGRMETQVSMENIITKIVGIILDRQLKCLDYYIIIAFVYL